MRRQRHGAVASRRTRVLSYTSVIAFNITAHCTDRTACGCAVNRAASAGPVQFRMSVGLQHVLSPDVLPRWTHFSTVRTSHHSVTFSAAPALLNTTRGLSSFWILPPNLLVAIYCLLPQRPKLMTLSPHSRQNLVPTDKTARRQNPQVPQLQAPR